MTDQFSRYILGCEAMSAINDDRAREACESIFAEHGIPTAIRSDNGAPFASTGLAGLTKLSVFWMRLGIQLERIRPAHPQDNGRHERMHRTLKRETTRPARFNLLQQQEAFDAFLDEFNHRRPHEALGMKPPGKVYKKSKRHLPKKLPDLDYPTHDDIVVVYPGGIVFVAGRKFHLTKALAGQPIGIREEEDGKLLLTFMSLDLGHFDGKFFEPLQPLAAA